MQSTSDIELLRQYARHGSEAAFGEIVRRYADFVYSAALRQVSDSELARDVAQLVFVDLARKAASLPPQTLLIGWLCRGARLAALDQLRRQHRRLQRERLAMELIAPGSEPCSDWSAIGPMLDEALARLAEEERHALLLRFFKDKSLATVGATLGISEDAAQKRVSRALGKLRDFLAERGVHTSAAALAIALAANAVQAAPAGFAASLTTAVLAQAAAAHSSFSLLNLLTTQKMKFALLSVVLAGGVAGLTVQQVKTQRQLRGAQATIQQQAEGLQTLQGVQDQLAAQTEELQRLRAGQQEAARLRGEVARLQRQAAAPSQPAPALAIGAGAALPTNAPVPEMQLTAKFVLVPTEDLNSLHLAWSGTADGSATLLLNADQVQTLNQALDGASDVKVLGVPRVATGSGVAATLFAGPQSSGASAGSGLGGGGGVASGAGGISLKESAAVGRSAAQPRPGLSLSVLPTFTEEAFSYDLQLTATYGQWVDRSPQQDGSQKEVQTTESKVHLTVPTGQTALLAKEVATEGWTEADATVPGPKSLLVFLTPTRFHGAQRLTGIIRKVTPSGAPDGVRTN